MRKLTFLCACLFMIGIGMVSAQSKTVSGKVLSAEDESPIIGASIVLAGTSQGTISDADGKFSIEVPNTSNNKLMISFIGMRTVEVEAKDGMTIKMQIDASELDEIVVTAMGISRNKKALGYATTSVSAKEIAEAHAINPMSAIQGKVAGVDIATSPGMGSTQNVIIRGFSSFGNNQPLYIVDGVPITNSQNRSGDNLNFQVDFGSGINALNPDNIADMTILKGAAATALYGSRAANGVVMITTKSGENTHGKLRVTYDGSVSLANVGFLPYEQKLFGQGWSGDMALTENGNWGAAFDGTERVWGNIVDNSQQLKKYQYLNNRIRNFYDLGVGFKNAVSLSGGNNNTKFHLSLSQNHADGVIPTNTDAYNRYTIAASGEHRSKHFTVSTSVNLSSEKNRAVASGQGTSMLRSLYEIATDISIVDLADYKNKFNNLDNYFTPYGLNPYFVLNENGSEQNKTKIFGKFQIDYNIWKKLKLTYRFGGDYESSISDTHRAVVSFTAGSPNESSSNTYTGSYEQIARQRVQMNHDAFLSWEERFNDFSINAIAGWNLNMRSSKYLSGTISSIDVPGFYNLSNTLSTPVAKQASSERRLYGIYINADLGFRDYLYLTLTARNDWSSTLPTDKNSFFYPGAMLSFILSDMLQQQHINTGIMDFAKIRLAFGQTGNDTDPYYIYNKYVTAEVTNPGYPDVDNLKFPIGGVNAYTVSNVLGNIDLKPEITTEFEAGLEMNFFKSRIGFDISYYNRLTKGLIELLPSDPSSGYTSRMTNLGDVRNSGVELTFNATPVRTKDFSWDISYNFSKNYNKVEKLDLDEVYISGFSGIGIYAVKGLPMGQFKSTVTETVNIDGVEHIVVDGSGNPVATTKEQFLGKDVNEKFRMGFTNTFSYKGFSLSGTLDFHYGGYIYSYTKSYMNWVGSAPESVMNERNPFIIPNSVVDNGDGTYSENTTPVDVTALHTFYSNGGLQRNDFAVIDRSYLKLRNASFAYSLPRKYCEAIKLTALKFSLNVSNILLWTPLENQYIDPETTTFGNDMGAKFGEFGANPSNEMYTFGLSVSF